MVQKLTCLSRPDFFNYVFEGQSYIYDPDYYLFKDIQKLARQKGVEIIYNQPGTKVYSELGCFNFTVIGFILPSDNPKSEALLFNPDNLVL